MGSRQGRFPYKDLVDFSTEEDATTSRLTADRGIYFSSDGLRRQEELLNVSHKKRRVQPSELVDSWGQWILLPDGDRDDDGVEVDDGVYDPGAVQSESADPATLGKRKEYGSTRDPAARWRPLMGFFLDKLARQEGLGDDLQELKCALCDRVCVSGEPTSPRFFKCTDGGQFLQCEKCCLSNHARTPLHVIREWNSGFWVPATLGAIGLIYQLGHGGFACEASDEMVCKMVIIEAPIIHQIRTLEVYRMYSVVGNMNVKDFVTSMERVTDTTASSGMTWVPNRYKQFQRMARQWEFLLRLLRAVRAHTEAGAQNTGQGECAVICWTCPLKRCTCVRL
ncbi:hypothetical protein DFH09DRAFT_1375123 [Mycena vulgaris]|nr:hypothetical protein DFH09DRAFT_1375123 [Mycena vulgaris]